MPKIRARVTRILDDGTEIDLVDIEDDPWFVRPVLKEALIKYVNQPAPPAQLEGQMEFEIKT